MKDKFNDSQIYLRKRTIKIDENEFMVPSLKT